MKGDALAVPGGALKHLAQAPCPPIPHSTKQNTDMTMWPIDPM